MCVLYGHWVIIRQQMEHYLLLLAPSVSFPSKPPPPPNPQALPGKKKKKKKETPFFLVVVADVCVRLSCDEEQTQRKRWGWGGGGGGERSPRSPQFLGSDVKRHQPIMVYSNHESTCSSVWRGRGRDASEQKHDCQGRNTSDF